MQLNRGFIVLDFGSQFTQLIARRLRELGFYSEIHGHDFSIDEIKKRNPYGIILSGGPNSVYETESPRRNIQELASVAPLLGICYGMQLITHELGGEVAKSDSREYGRNKVEWKKYFGSYSQNEFRISNHAQSVWMSHGDSVKRAPSGFEVVAQSDSGHPAAMCSDRIWAIQFHPEVAHTERGEEILRAFCAEFCKAPSNWQAPEITNRLVEDIRKQVVNDEHVLCALSGGVDSSVVALLLTKALGADRVHCVFVDHGLLRKNEFETVLAVYKKIGLNVHGINASTEFLNELTGVEDPEKKRKIIGRLFIEIFEKTLERELQAVHAKIKWLAQGTLYPDVIESVSSKGGSVTIKSHHNVGGLPEKMKLKLIEPLRELFKDEVRRVGAQLGLDAEVLNRHPFPGPGLAIRIMGAISKDDLHTLKEADAIFIDSLKREGLYQKIWQAFCVLLPVKTVGVQGDGRTYEKVLALRAVTSHDGMTADWYDFESSFLRRVSNEITNKVRGVNRIVYDVTSKPPGTIEWE